MGDQLSNIFQSLDINDNNGLVITSDLQKLNTDQKSLFIKIHEKLGIDAVYYLRDNDGKESIPLIYFSTLQYYDAQKNAELHKLAWNTGEAPLLFIVTPESLIIYDNYEAPIITKKGGLDPKSGLIEELELVNGLVLQADKLKKYHRSRLESGEFWEINKKRFTLDGRVDATLISNLKIMRERLISQIEARGCYDEKNIVSVVNALLCRSIFIKYLEERTGKDGQHVFKADFYAEYMESAKQYTDILKDKKATYDFFHALKRKFNGDILKDAEHEQEIIGQDELDMLRIFLSGECELEDGQLALWRLYSFDVIPVHFISSVYETFYHLSDDDGRGTYYTPQHLVSMLMDEVYPWDGEYQKTTFLDPSCGSGIFLAEAYRRIIYRWINQNNKDTALGTELGSILKNSIIGVDINGEAIRVASFSLYLTMCDFLDPTDIWDNLVFPDLIGENLFENDFFDESDKFNGKEYDIVIGNPPWQSSITDKTKEYIKKRERIIGDNQAAQAFSIKCSELCKTNGMVCLVMPSKGMLFNRSEKNRNYREQFFKNNTVLEIINLTEYKSVLFERAKEPATAVIYIPSQDASDQPIIYCTPKPTYTIEDTKHFSIDPSDICMISRNMVSDDKIWKVAMVGGPRDFDLINKMQRLGKDGTMLAFTERNKMTVAEGFKRGNQKDKYTDFIDYPYVETKTIVPYYVEKDQLRVVDFDRFERIASEGLKVFQAPHLVMKQSPVNECFVTAVLDYDAVFNHSILGINGDVEKLKYLSVIISSEVFSYYHMMVSGRWDIERSELEKGEIMQTPIPEPDKEELKEAVMLYNESAYAKRKAPGVENFVRRMYGINETESHLIHDAIYYTHDALKRKRKSRAFMKPELDDYRLYYRTIKDLLKNTFGSSVSISGNLYSGNAPLSVILLNIKETDSDNLKVISSEETINSLLSELDKSLQNKNQMIYIRKNLRVYKSNEIYIIKPSQSRYWTYSAACRDGDDIFKDVSNAWR